MQPLIDQGKRLSFPNSDFGLQTSDTVILVIKNKMQIKAKYVFWT